jgi:hypothetical protein
MKIRESISISYCEKCGSKVSGRDEVCSNCGTLPYQDDRNFKNENNIPDDVYIDDWSDEINEKFDRWIEVDTEVKFCKDCGKRMEEVRKYDDDYVNEESGEVITTNNHPCNPNSPIFE